MKRLCVSFLIFLSLSLYNLYAEYYVLNLCDDLIGMLQICAEDIRQEKYSQAENAVSKLYDIWEEKDDILSVFIGDDSVIEPRKSIVSIILSIRDGNFDECLINIRECQGYFHDIKENNSTNLSNIL